MPRTWTAEDIHQEIRRKLKFDPGNLYTDEEGDEKGMAAHLGLKTQVDIARVIDDRKKDAAYQFGVINYTIKEDRRAYE